MNEKRVSVESSVDSIISLYSDKEQTETSRRWEMSIFPQFDFLPLPDPTPRRFLGFTVPKWSRTTLYREVRYFLFEKRGLWLLIWLLVQLTLFLTTFLFYSNASNYSLTFSILGNTLPIARGSAAVINLASSLSLFLMCKRTLTAISRFGMLRQVFCLDSTLLFHRWIGYSIFTFSLIHVIAHCFNYAKFSSFSGEGLAQLFFLGPTGATGVLLIVCLVGISVTSIISAIRRYKYEIFYYVHWLYVPYYAMLLLHGSFCFIKENSDLEGTTKCTSKATFWKYFLLPASIFIAERCLDMVERFRPATIQKVILHGSDTLEIQFTKPLMHTGKAWNFIPGQYVYVNIPEISRFQWHPFTLTCSPHDQNLSIHIQMKGDWTKAVLTHFELAQHAMETSLTFSKVSFTLQDFFPTLIVSPALYAPADQADRFQTLVLVGCGIGITPYLSILKSLTNGNGSPPFRKLHLIWICRDVAAFSSFQKVLKEVEAGNLGEYVDISLYWTVKASTLSMCHNVSLDFYSDLDTFTGLRSKTYFGRPNWQQVLGNIAVRNGTKEMGVFVCGPRDMAKNLAQTCKIVSEQRNRKISCFTEVF